MFSKYKMSWREKCELEEYRGTGLTPQQIRELESEAARIREYIEWLENL